MNRLHHWYCSREAWKRRVREDLVPAAIDGHDLGQTVLDVGPGFGPATDVLARRVDRLTALERSTRALRPAARAPRRQVDVVEGDGTAMPYADG